MSKKELEVTIYERWEKIKGKVYIRRSFDEGQTWTQYLTPLKELPYAPAKLK